LRIYRDRQDAGAQLADALLDYAGPETVVVGLPRGGMPVAAEVASRLGAPLDVFVVRKLGVPWQPELAMGAIASGGVLVRNERVLQLLPDPEASLAQVRQREQAVLAGREAMYRGQRPALDLAGKRVIVVDDGVATGATMKAAVKALRKSGASSVIVAVPVGAPDTCRELEEEADALVCLQSPRLFSAVGQWYEDFGQTTDEEVGEILRSASG
jgi:putative phosphoribosyl transferase